MNFKKFLPGKDASQKRILDFFDKKGFYIVLVLCIAVIGVTVALVTTNNIMSNNDYLSGEDIISPEMASNISTDMEEGFENPGLDVESAANVAAPVTDATTKPSVTGESAKATSQPKKTDTSKEDTKSGASSKKTTTKTTTKKASTKANTTNNSKLQTFAMPVFGQITFEYAKDNLVYSKTLNEWRTHTGIDIKADRGTPVKVVADGVVTEIKNDPRLGVMVIVEHTQGIKTVYANLASGDMVTPNQKVKKGEVIGAVGNTAAFEAAEAPHLHFEVLKDNESVDPNKYLPKNAESAVEKK